MSVSEGRYLLIRQLIEALDWTPDSNSVGRLSQVLAALDRLGFEVIPRTTLEADRRSLTVTSIELELAEGWGDDAYDEITVRLADGRVFELSGVGMHSEGCVKVCERGRTDG